MAKVDVGGLDNVADNVRANIAELLSTYQQSELGTRFREIYEEDTVTPDSNSIAIDIQRFDTLLRSSANRTQVRYTINIDVDMIYYHEEIDERHRKRDTERMIWKISQMFMKHQTVNGFAPLGAEVVSGEYIHKIRGQKVFAAGIVKVRIPYMHTVTNAD